MDVATAASVAALVVAILAMAIAFAQALQQYLITGQLIRICDSVVYGKMPGKGHRVWEFAQFRFRVVYSVPQICLKSSLWRNGLKSVPAPYEEDHLLVPDLRHDLDLSSAIPGNSIHSRPRHQGKSTYSAVPGEASWVSFARVAQHASCKDIFYALVTDDADRCPSDLPVVPMQVALRDIVVLALMAGMHCTDASFEMKSLSMDGDVGSITTSKHPILGSVIHFAPRVRNDGRLPGLRIDDGCISMTWIARMSDTLIIAGRFFNVKERAYYEDYEQYRWVTLTSDQTIAKLLSVSPLELLSSTVRSRRSSSNSWKPASTFAKSSGHDADANDVNVATATSEDTQTVPQSGHDGDWTWSLEDLEPTAPVSNHISTISSHDQEFKAAGPQRNSWVRLLRLQVHKLLNRSNSRTHDHHFQSYGIDVERLDDKKETEKRSNAVETKYVPRQEESVQQEMSHGSTLQRLDGIDLQEYISDKRSASSRSNSGARLLLTWSEENATTQTSNTGNSPDGSLNDDDLYERIKLERSASYLNQWQDVLYTRQRSRVKRALKDEKDATTARNNRSSSQHRNSYPSSRRSSLKSSRQFSRSSRARALSLPAHKQDLDDDKPFSRSYSLDRRGRTRYRSPVPAGAGMKEYPLDTRTDTLSETTVVDGQSSDALPLNQDLTDEPKESDAKEPEVNKPRRERRVGFRDWEELIDPPSEFSSRRTEEPSHQRGSKNARNDTPYAYVNEPVTEESDAKGDDSLNHRRGILKPPTRRFPVVASEVGKNIESLRDAQLKKESSDIPRGARWTKIDRKLVDVEALTEAGEQFEERDDNVIVLRILTRNEVQRYVDRTRVLRELRQRDEEEDYEVEQMDESNMEIDGGQFTPDQSSSGSDMSISPQRVKRAYIKRPRTQRFKEENDDVNGGSGVTLESVPISKQPRRGRAPSTSTFRTERSRSYRPKSARRNSAETEEIIRPPIDDLWNTKSPFWDEVVLEDESFSDEDGSVDMGGTQGVRGSSERAERIKGSVNWFWISQADVLPGYVATAWHHHFSDTVCFGALVTMLEILQYFTDHSTLKFVGQQANYKTWLLQGKSTHPSYAINAMGGVIVSGKYKRTKFDCLSTKIPPIELLHSYEHQVDREYDFSHDSQKIVEVLGEIMGLDSWLSFCGRLPEICDGRNNLLRRTPALVQKIMTDFDYEFQNLDRTASEGGFQVIKEVSELVMLELEDLNLSSAEQLFSIVAVLRTAKAALSVLKGPSTAKLADVLAHEVRVYIV